MLLSEAAEYPFDLAKVRLQSQLLSSTSSDGQSRFKGPMDCLMQTWRDEGFKGLYRGLPVPLYSAHPTTTPKPTLLPDSRPPGPFSIARHVVATNGLRGLWLGHIGTVLRETGGTAVWFAVKKWMARVLKDRRSTSGFTPVEKNPSLGVFRRDCWRGMCRGVVSGGYGEERDAD
ncbi:mitochondrial carrier domain-containing protein [Lentinula raphanica]|nr:mitochondrial carrier domain-containing protein [Lentinula raphanica]